MHIESSGLNHKRDNTTNYASFSRYDLHNITKISFHYNRFSKIGAEKGVSYFGNKFLDEKSSWNSFFTPNKDSDYTHI